MKRFFRICFMLAMISVLVSCSGGEKAADNNKVKAATSPATVQPVKQVPQGKVFRSITPMEAKGLISQRQNLLMVDLREARELREGYINGSVLIPVSDLSKGTKSIPADRPLLLICAVGGRSYAVGRYFSGKGYPEIYNLKGGIASWKKAGLPLEYPN